MPSIQHRTRGRRFSIITVGDISKWSRGSEWFKYPEPKNRKAKPASTEDNPVPVHSMAMMKPQQQVIIGSIEPPKPKVTVGDAADGMTNAGNSTKIAAVFERMVQRRP